MGFEILGLLPDQLYSLTLFELQSLHYNHLRLVRDGRYNAFMTAWYPNHRDGDQPPMIEDFWPLPGDPGWQLPKKGFTLEDHIEMMRERGEGGPP